jgi:hypothetical protein
MSDYNDLCRFQNAKLPIAIIKYPSGKFGLSGSIPIELTIPNPRGWDKDSRMSMYWDSEDDAIQTLLNAGYTHFQLDNCEWYDAIKV